MWDKLTEEYSSSAVAQMFCRESNNNKLGPVHHPRTSAATAAMSTTAAASTAANGVTLGRKYSMHVTTLSPNPPTATRRLSQVGVEMTRRLSTSIGWRTLGVGGTSASAVVVDEAKGLCAQYIRARFRRSGIIHRKLGLQRLRSVVNMTASYGSCDTFASLDVLGQELEARHAKLYVSICRQICRTITSEESVRCIFHTVAQELLGSSAAHETVTWAKVVALFAVAGGLAVDCVQQGHVDYVLKIIDCFGQFVERELATWIVQHGGWNTLMKIVSPHSSISLNAFQATATLIGLFTFLLTIYGLLYFRL